MASKERIERLQQLVAKAGNSRKAEQLIKKKVGVAPTHSAIYKAMQLESKTTDYIVQCYIRDLEFALFSGDRIMKTKVITQTQFSNLKYKLASSYHKTHIFTCQIDGFEIELFEGDEDEHFSVHFKNDVSVLADEGTNQDDLDEDGYLNIDARPEIIFDYLSGMIHQK